MKEKRNIKLRTDMYEDTKFKIIDTMAERDTINYIWTRLLTLCGKVNNPEGKLYVTKNMPSTMEILVVEFNRSFEQIENAINVFIDLNMVSKDSNGALKINNWCKYQGTGRRNEKNEEKKKSLNVNKEDIEYKKHEDDYNDVLHDKYNENIETKKADNIKEMKKKNDESLNKSNEIKANIIDISNGDLVKDKKRVALEKSETTLNIKNKKTKVRKKKKAANNNNDIIVTNEDEMENEIIEFTEPLPMPEDCRSIAVFNFT